MTIKTYKRPARVNPYAVAEAVMRSGPLVVLALALIGNIMYVFSSGILLMTEAEMSTGQSLSLYAAFITILVGGMILLGTVAYQGANLYERGVKNLRRKKYAWESRQVSD